MLLLALTNCVTETSAWWWPHRLRGLFRKTIPFPDGDLPNRRGHIHRDNLPGTAPWRKPANSFRFTMHTRWRNTCRNGTIRLPGKINQSGTSCHSKALIHWSLYLILKKHTNMDCGHWARLTMVPDDTPMAPMLP